MNHISQNSTGVLLVISHLGTSIRMGKRNDILDIATDQFLCLTLKCLCDAVDTANGRDDPDLVSYTDFSIGTAISVKICMLGLFQSRSNRMILVLKQITQSGL